MGLDKVIIAVIFGMVTIKSGGSMLFIDGTSYCGAPCNTQTDILSVSFKYYIGNDYVEKYYEN